MSTELFSTETMRASATNVAQSLGQSVGTRSSQAASAASAKSTTKATSSAASDVTSGDFLNLLVTEMKNQDPTQPTDPNAYIQQLVGVNSLQQLIAINQDLTPTTTVTGNTTSATGKSVAAASSV